MSRLLTCPAGHQWELAASVQAGAADGTVPCPVCAAAVPVDRAAAQPTTFTVPPGSPPAVEAPSQAETVAPPSGPAGGTELPRIPGYEILDELGRGGMGVVYRARHTRLDRLVAVKTLPANLGADPAFAERFTREARALARLSHPHIITVHDFGQSEGGSYFIMEYVEGANLRQLLRAGPLPPEEVRALAVQVCDALQYAHEEGIVHRDIKPENILRDRKGRVKIADFGIAKLLSHQTAQFTLTGPWQLLGTLHYMAPEQIEDPLSLDQRADIYSLGVVLYELLTGSRPVGHFPLPSQKAAVDGRFDAVILMALANDPGQRYQNAGEMKAALEALAGEPRRAAAPRAETGTEVLPVREAGPAIRAGETELNSIRKKVERCALGLRFVAFFAFGQTIISLLLTVFAVAYFRYLNDLSLVFLAYALISLPVGVVIVIGAGRMQRLQSHNGALVSATLAVLPLSFHAFLGVPVGLWSLWVLTRRDVVAAFTGGKGLVTVGGWVMARLRKALSWVGSTTGLAMLDCLAGTLVALQPITPMVELQVQAPFIKGETLAEVFGYEYPWVFAGILFLAVLLLLIATGPPEPRSRWRSFLLIASGVMIAALTAGLISANDARPLLSSAGKFGHPGAEATGHVLLSARNIPISYHVVAVGNVQEVTIHARERIFNHVFLNGLPGVSSDVQNYLRCSIRPPAYAVLALGFSLLLLGTFQFRGVLMRSRSAPQGADAQLMSQGDRP